MTVFTSISKALDDHLNNFAETNSIEIAWENRSFDADTDQIYLRPTDLPGNTEPTGGIDASDDNIGIYQVDVIGPINNGKGAIRDQADLLVTHFKRNTLLTHGGQTVRIEAVSRSRGARDGSSFIMNISARYRAFTPAR